MRSHLSQLLAPTSRMRRRRSYALTLFVCFVVINDVLALGGPFDSNRYNLDNIIKENSRVVTASYIIEDANEYALQESPLVESERTQQEAVDSRALPSSLTTTDPPTQPQVKWINKDDLLELVAYLAQEARSSEKSAIVIDTRNSNEYNGWKSFSSESKATTKIIQVNNTSLLSLYDMKNGHVNDAHNFDADWIHLFDSDMLNNLAVDRIGLKLKNTNRIVATGDIEQPSIPVILYDTQKTRLEKVRNYLTKNFVLSEIYLCQLEEDEINTILVNTNETSSLFFQEPFYDMLISAEVLNAILRPFNESYVINVRPLTNYKLFDVSRGGPDKHYERSHIPTAVHLSVNEFEDAPLWVRKNRTELAKLLLNCGIAPNNTEMIILYGNPDPMASYRVALLLKYMGVKDVHVLNGGYRSWLIKNFPVESYANKRMPLKKGWEKNIKLYEDQSYNSQQPINYIVDQEYVNDLVKNHDLFSQQYTLVDLRSYEEHVGEKSGYGDLKERGRIPGSLWGKAGSNANQLEDYRNPDLTMRSGTEILKMWDELGIDYKHKHIIFYSGNGWRASEVMFYAELMGLYRISVYDGGWYEWSHNANNSIQIGPNKESDSLPLGTKESTSTTTTEPIDEQQSTTVRPLKQAKGTSRPPSNNQTTRSHTSTKHAFTPLNNHANNKAPNGNKHNLTNAVFFEILPAGAAGVVSTRHSHTSYTTELAYRNPFDFIGSSAATQSSPKAIAFLVSLLALAPLRLFL